MAAGARNHNIAARRLRAQAPAHLSHLDFSAAGFNGPVAPDISDMNVAAGGANLRAGAQIPQTDVPAGGFHSNRAADVGGVDVATRGGQPGFTLQGAVEVDVSAPRLEVEIEMSGKLDVEFHSHGVIAAP